jgi:hypothetical protein
VKSSQNSFNWKRKKQGWNRKLKKWLKIYLNSVLRWTLLRTLVLGWLRYFIGYILFDKIWDRNLQVCHLGSLFQCVVISCNRSVKILIILVGYAIILLRCLWIFSKKLNKFVNILAHPNVLSGLKNGNFWWKIGFKHFYSTFVFVTIKSYKMVVNFVRGY